MDQKFFDVAFASAGDQTTVPDTVQSTGSVSFPQGWGFDYQRDQDTDPAAKPIDRGTMNYLLWCMTIALQQYQTNGTPEFITAANNNGAAYPYAKHARVRYSATVPGVVFESYVSTVDGNTAVPGASANWQLESDIIASSAEATAGVNARNIMTPFLVAQQDALRALLAGNATQVFNVAAAVAGTQALNRDAGDARYMGQGQTWQNVIGSRAIGTTYTNTTGRAIELIVVVAAAASSGVQLRVNGIIIIDTSATSAGGSFVPWAGCIVPSGATYFVNAGVALTYWNELR